MGEKSLICLSDPLRFGGGLLGLSPQLSALSPLLQPIWEVLLGAWPQLFQLLLRPFWLGGTVLLPTFASVFLAGALSQTHQTQEGA